MVREKYAVVIGYEVDYRFKSGRIGTVEPVTTKDSSITKVLEYDCKGGAVCTYAVEGAALTHTDSYDYGYGITLYNGTMPEDYGNQVFDYQTKLYHIGREFTGNTASNSTDVVKYQPRYDVYPYLFLIVD